MTLALAEEKFFCQRSRIQWLKYGDSNTAFYFKMVTTRRSDNQIHFLIGSDGRRIDNRSEIEEHCVAFFKDLLAKESTPLTAPDRDLIGSLSAFRCTPEMQSMLIAEVSAAEIKETVFALPILKQWNCTIITLIPKKVNADKISEFRHISLCNVLYKIISMIIAKRLEIILPSMVSPHQSAFVKGRLLIENVLLATEMVQKFNQKNISSRGVLKVDLRKAFDSLRWDFIIQVLKAAQFPSTFINWIQQCITTTSFSINVNGDLCGFFKGEQGVRQGDPISPYLFIIAMEVFGRLLERKFEDGSIGYHPKGQDPKISHLAFADDVMVFFDGSHNSLNELSSTLETFHRLSGLEMNREKSALYTAGTDAEEQESLAAFGFTQGSFPFRYLGLPLTHMKLQKSEYSPLLDAISNRFNHWTTKALTFAGRLQLISSVICSTVNFWISAFMLPKACIKQIEGMCNHFMWSGDIAKKHGVKVAWSTVCQPKEEGGLGLRNFSLWNKTLNLKLIWLLFSNSDSLWVAWMRKHNLKDHRFWSAPAMATSSWI
ncbi:uncharacterized protein LOC106356058 [Brassica napus]|uniref:uncharacterized protein LOC106356058 n=1 Tax=Brassica napus TaxID=3708 RepID=UPI0006AB1945|nr:uncharacterized protein LOC106356058 [Brassica napus]